MAIALVTRYVTSFMTGVGSGSTEPEPQANRKRCSQAQHRSCLTRRINAGGDAELLQLPDVPVLEMEFRAGPAIWS